MPVAMLQAPRLFAKTQDQCGIRPPLNRLPNAVGSSIVLACARPLIYFVLALSRFCFAYRHWLTRHSGGTYYLPGGSSLSQPLSVGRGWLIANIQIISNLPNHSLPGFASPSFRSMLSYCFFLIRPFADILPVGHVAKSRLNRSFSSLDAPDAPNREAWH